MEEKLATRDLKTEEKAGFREPYTAAEQRFWDCFVPDYNAWALKDNLSLDEATALSMHLDPACVEFISEEEIPTYQRFLQTKNWFVRYRDKFPQQITLESISVIGGDMGDDNLSFHSELDRAVDLHQGGYLDAPAQVALLQTRIERMQEQYDELARKLASLVLEVPTSLSIAKPRRPSDETNVERTSSRIISALIANSLPQREWRVEFIKVRNQKPSKISARVTHAGLLLGWKIDQDTLLARLREALVTWDPEVTVDSAEVPDSE